MAVGEDTPCRGRQPSITRVIALCLANLGDIGLVHYLLQVDIMRRTLSLPLVFTVSLGTFAGCNGSVLEAPASENNPREFCDVARPGPSPMRRLNSFEYNNTIRDLLGDDSGPANEFPAEEEALGFNNNATALGVTPILAERYMIAAEGIAARATGDLAGLLPCDPADIGEDECAREFASDFGTRAFRHPLETEEVERLVSAYNWGKENGLDFRESISVMLETILQSPHFLYRVEFGDGSAVATGEAVALDDWERATRLSYLLWGTMPDQELFDAAEAGLLSDPEIVKAQAERMLADPRARYAVHDFYSQWLELDLIDNLEKDKTIFPTFTKEIRGLVRKETEAFMDYVIWEGDGNVQTLLTADFSFMNAKLAAFYGVEGPSGSEFEKVQLSGERGGLLTQASFLASQAKPNQASPIHRGKFVREQLLCQPLPPPPNDANLVLPELDSNLTTRERFSQHSSDPSCSGCHELLDPIGFGFENFDGAGNFRTQENNQPIDASGELIATDVDGPFVGVTELVSKLASSEQVRNCVVTQYFRYGNGRAEAGDDRCSLEPLMGEFAQGGNLRELIVSFTQTDAFLYRNAVVAE